MGSARTVLVTLFPLVAAAIFEVTSNVTVRKGFKTAGGPCTFIQITNQDKDAIRTHLESMKRLASKWLCRNPIIKE